MPTESIRITCSTEDLDAKLSKSMKLLGAHHDEYGRLVNANGQFIAGLSQARIKMGDWIDSLGRARDAAGGFLDGLTATELKLRYYKDEVGNVYDAEGNLIRVSDELARAQRERLAAAEAEAARQAAEAAKAQEELATAGERGMKSLLSGAKGAAKMANNLSLMIGVLGGGNEGLNKFGQQVVIATQTFSQFALAMKTLPKFIEGFKLLTIATQGQSAAQVILNAVSGNWVALIAGGLAAGTLAYKSLSASTKEVAEKTVQAAAEVDALGIAYQRLQTAQVGEANAIQAGAIAAGVSEIEMLEKRREKVLELEQTYKTAADAYANADKALRDYESNTGEYSKRLQESRFGKIVSTPFGGTDYAKVQENEAKRREQMGARRDELAEASAEYARAVQQMISQDLPRDEMRELQERAQKYAETLKSESLTEEARRQISGALAENQRKQAELVQRQNQEAERAAKEAAERQRAEAEKKLAEAQSKLGDKFDAYAEGSPLWTAQEKAANDLNKTIAAWRENFAAAGKSEAELNAAIETLTAEYNQKRLQEYLDANNLKIREDKKLTAEEQYAETLDRIREAQEQYGLQAAEAAKLREQAESDYADALKKRAEDEEKQRESRLNELGITGLREQMKTPLQKMLEQQMKVSQAAQEGLISAQEAQAMNAKLAADYIQANRAGESEQAAEARAEEYQRASTLEMGSNELYQALTNRESGTEKYQSGVTKNLEQMSRYGEDNNDLLNTINSNLAGVMKAVGVI